MWWFNLKKSILTMIFQSKYDRWQEELIENDHKPGYGYNSSNPNIGKKNG